MLRRFEASPSRCPRLMGMASAGRERGPLAIVLRSAVGASRPLRRIPAIVSFLNPQPALRFVGGNLSSCSTPAVRDTCSDRLNWVEAVRKLSGHPLINEPFIRGAK